MKKTIFVLSIMLITLPGFSQPRKYKKSMEKAIESITEASSPEDFSACAASFGEIASTYPELWLPSYYSAYCLISASFDAGDYTTRIEALNQAKVHVEQAKKLKPDESETEALDAFHALGMMAADPDSNGPLYLQDFTFCIEKAKELNPDNPRPYYMDGLLKSNLPEFMGGGVHEARQLHQIAAKKFEEFQNDDPFWPSWGAAQNHEVLHNLQ